MATPKEQRDARPGARNVGTGDQRHPPADASPPPAAGDVGPPRERDSAHADPERPPLDAPSTD